MWLTQKLTDRKNEASLQTGTVTSTEAEKLTIQAESEYRAPKSAVPYGISSIPPAGMQGIMMNGYYIGIPQERAEGLEAGEICLFSAGGAEIRLKNNGDILINGQLFPLREN